MSQITVKGKIARLSKVLHYAVVQVPSVTAGKVYDSTFDIENPPDDWKQFQEVSITIRSV